MKTKDGSNRRKAEKMSSFVCTDYTVLAIVEGMHGLSYIKKRDKNDMAEALRIINEVQTSNRDPEKVKHHSVNMNHSRKFTNEEIYQSCQCWLYQVDTGKPVPLDYITIIASVKMLAKAIKSENVKNGSWKEAHWFGNKKVLVQNDDGGWDEISKTVEWDLAA